MGSSQRQYIYTNGNFPPIWGNRSEEFTTVSIGKMADTKNTEHHLGRKSLPFRYNLLIGSKNVIVFQDLFSLFLSPYQSGTPVLSIVRQIVGALICTKRGQVQAFN